jgi:aminobenzoyl-glutamate utilization protein A
MKKEELEEIEKMDEALRRRRESLHMYPEPGFCEVRTTSIIARTLTDLGFDEVLTGKDVCDADSRMGLPDQKTLDAAYKRALGEEETDPAFAGRAKDGFTGVIGILHCGEGPTVAMRFDIDALPVHESKDSSHYPTAHGFNSRHEGFMHACGHDGHTTVGLGTAAFLIRHRDQLHGTLKLIFQPAEEGVRGARSIVAKGHLDDVDFCLGSHMGGAPDTKALCIGAGMNGSLATTKINADFTGRSAHAGAMPEKGNNALLAAATAVLNLHAIPRTSQGDTRVNVGRLIAEGGRNVICDNAHLELEVRGTSKEANEYMEQYAVRILNAAAEMHQCTVALNYVGAAATIVNTPALVDEVRKAAGESGMPAIDTGTRSAGSEDYSFMSQCVTGHGGQSCFFNNISRCAGPFHSPIFDFQEEALVSGVKEFSQLAFDLMQKK